MTFKDKLVADGVITIDQAGVIRLTESAWVSMTTPNNTTTFGPVVKRDFSKKERD